MARSGLALTHAPSTESSPLGLGDSIARIAESHGDAFAQKWVRAWWSAHDLDAVLERFRSRGPARSSHRRTPHAARLLERADGVIRDTGALRRSWAEGLRPIADRHFERLGAYVGIHTTVTSCRDRRGRLCNEMLTFDGPLVVEGHGTYREPGPYQAAG